MKTTFAAGKTTQPEPTPAPARRRSKAPIPSHTNVNYWTQSDEIAPGPGLIKRGFKALRNAFKRP